MSQWLDDYLTSQKTTCSFQASGFDPERLEYFVKVLEAYGLNVDCNVSASGKTASVTVRGLPETLTEAKEKATRNAGRKLRVILPNSSVFNSDTTCQDFLDYAASHKVSETMAQLGITSRPKYYRVLDVIKDSAGKNGSIKLFNTSIRFTHE